MNVKEAYQDSVTVNERDLQRYFELNMQKKEIEKEMNQLKSFFHQFLDSEIGELEKGELERGNFKLQRQIRSAILYDEASTVQLLEELRLEDCIILEKKPDIEKLEAAFKLGIAEESAFQQCRQTKNTKAITVKKIGR